MKKTFIILVVLTFLSCSQEDNSKFIITDFTKSRTDTLKPLKWKKKSPFHSYVMYSIRVNGYVNDTVKIKHKGFF